VHSESRLDRSLWTIVLTVAVGLVIANFAQGPLFGNDGEASGFTRPLTLWIAGGETGSQTESVARQVAACWELGGRSTSVGVLPGSSTSAVVDFLGHRDRTPDQLLLLTSLTLADIAHEARETAGSEARERAQQATRLLADSPLVSLLGSDPLTLAVRADSPLRSTGQLLALMRERSSQPLIGIAEDTWLQGNLAALAVDAGVGGEMPFDAYRSSREAVVSLDAGEIGVVLAPRIALARDIQDGRLRALSWPGAATPRAWVALLAPRGLDAIQLASLRQQADGLCAGGTWQRMLRGDGLTPQEPRHTVAVSFVHDGLAEATRLQALAAQIVRDY
jgi:LysR substrate binding domain